MTVTVHCFARARELVGGDTVRHDLPAAATVGDLRRSLAAAYPSLGPLLSRSALAVDQEFAGDETPLRDGAEVAIVPPVSGGSGLRVSSPSLPLA